ncbi:MAG: hypothetical protein ACR2OU_10900 [Thermomicrobiales bacterium]
MVNKSGKATFSVGVVFGSIGGFMLGAVLGRYVFSLTSILLATVTRRNADDNGRPKFEWLLQ